MSKRFIGRRHTNKRQANGGSTVYRKLPLVTKRTAGAFSHQKRYSIGQTSFYEISKLTKTLIPDEG
jgi:hypothetical protein